MFMASRTREPPAPGGERLETPNMPSRSRKPWIPAAIPLLFAFMGCDPLHSPECTCDRVLYLNICAQGKYDKDDSVAYHRERGDGPVDTHAPGIRECFEELTGRQRILVLKNGVRIDSSAWFTVRTVDCCHGEAKVVVF